MLVDVGAAVWLSVAHRRVLADVARRNEAAHGDDLLGLVLSGSAGRGLATERSDVDVYVVLSDDGMGGRRTVRSPAVDEIPVTLTELEAVPPFASDGWWYRWSFAWAPVLLDRTDGRLAAALQRQATVPAEEAEAILVRHDRLDRWLNYAYRALKNDRDGRRLERRLEAAEAVPWRLDVGFTLAGSVRPCRKHMRSELRERPRRGSDADELLALLQATLDGDPAALRTTFERVERQCRAFDDRRPRPVLGPVIDGWGSQLDLLRC